MYVVILGCIAGGVASWIYVPVFGKQLAACAFAGAAGLMSYQLGYNARAQLDQSIKLQEQLAATQAQLAQTQADLKTNAEIATQSAQREREATKAASDLQSKVSDYEKSLRDMEDKTPETIVVHDGKKTVCPPIRKISGCLLNDADVTGLRGIGAASGRH